MLQIDRVLQLLFSLMALHLQVRGKCDSLLPGDRQRGQQGVYLPMSFLVPPLWDGSGWEPLEVLSYWPENCESFNLGKGT